MNPLIDVSSADPGIFYYKDYYYIVATTGNDPNPINIWQSKDMSNWEKKGTVYTSQTKPSWQTADVRKKN